jgi:DNA modification methylase
LKTPNIVNILSKSVTQNLFPPGYELTPDINDLYELELAYYEKQILSDDELVNNGAYFLRVNNEYTRHFKMCMGESLKLPAHSSSRLKSFFEKNLFRTGYATHGLFPYRGKFHPQMIKGLINIMGLKPGDTVLDPMMGSGTVMVEATLMGIGSIGIDASPFCRLMTQAKIDALTMSLTRVKNASDNYLEVFDYFEKKAGRTGAKKKTSYTNTLNNSLSVMEEAAQYVKKQASSMLTKQEKETVDTYNFLLLAYLDSVGYSERSQRKTPVEQFKAILERYIFVVEKIQKVIAGMEKELVASRVLEADARDIPLDDSTIDGIVFSPPYSFAIDYIENDSFHLNFLGADTGCLREKMIGLRGKRLSEKFELYKTDMEKVISECSRVLRKGRICTIIVGTNNNQLGKVLKKSPDEVPGLHEMLIEMGASFGFRLVKMMSRPIMGISNTMRKEHILMLQKN